MNHQTPRTVCLVTSTRADYGILKPLAQKLSAAPELRLRIVATGMHLCPDFGETWKEIAGDGLSIHRKIGMQLSDDSPAGMSKSMGLALILFAEYFAEHMPDLVILLGDRYEIAAIGCAAVNQRIPIAHIHGGEESQGAVDNVYRHALTKMSSLHFTSCEAYRERVIRMGEAPETVFSVGAMGVENVLNAGRLDIAALSASLGRPLEEKGYAVVTFHPVTLEDDTGEAQMRALTAALDAFPGLDYVVTKANADAGGRKINALWERFAATRQNVFLADSLGCERYLSALKHSAMMIGNSSSGIIEGPSYGIPVVNIGDRQKGRIKAGSVIDCPPEYEAITAAMQKALTPEFRELAQATPNPYGQGDASGRIAALIREYLQRPGPGAQKFFYDMPM